VICRLPGADGVLIPVLIDVLCGALCRAGG
jgi:hypothetical protein